MGKVRHYANRKYKMGIFATIGMATIYNIRSFKLGQEEKTT